jgi:hypothetical protein
MALPTRISRRGLAALAHALLLVSLAALAAWGGLVLEKRLRSSDPIERIASPFRHDTVSWEVHAFLTKAAAKLGRILPNQEDHEELLRRFYTLSARLARSNDPSLLQEHQRLRNRVETILEGRITRLLKEEGITFRPPLFDHWQLVFPPVAVDLASPPTVLVVSPREAIRLERAILLAPGMDIPLRKAMERDVDATGVSSLVVSVGGMATYPSTVAPLTSYSATVETAIHEWVHHYLALFPLGRHYFHSPEMRTINETVADMVAKELTAKFTQRWPAPIQDAPPSPPPAQLIHRLRALRQQVEALLARGDVPRAERLMEEERERLAKEGFYFRKINQAFFAFYGLYAESPASISPIGDKLKALRRRAGSLRSFLELVSGITSEAELDMMLASSN